MSGLTKTEQNALLKILKARFELLHEEKNRRERLVRVQLSKELKEENAAKISAVESEMDAFSERLRNISDEIQKVHRKAKGDGLELGRYGGAALSYTLNPTVSIKDEDQIIERRMQEIRDKGPLNGGLRSLELKLTEKILVGSLEGSDAKEIMAEIPSIDDIIPLTTSMSAAIEAPKGGTGKAK
jgi:hypothetical protein